MKTSSTRRSLIALARRFTIKKRLSQLYHRFDVTNRTSLIHKFKGKA